MGKTSIGIVLALMVLVSFFVLFFVFKLNDSAIPIKGTIIMITIVGIVFLNAITLAIVLSLDSKKKDLNIGKCD